MTTLLTRPDRDAAPILARFHNAGLRIYNAPMMTIKQKNIPQIDQQKVLLAQANSTARLIFTSANGVRALVAQIPQIVTTACYCVGKQTSACAYELGFRDISTAKGDVISLLQDIKDTKDVQNIAWFHIRGHDHCGDLIQQLQQKNYNATAICAYNAVNIAELSTEIYTAIVEGKIDQVMIYSPRTAQLLERVLSQAGLLSHCTKIKALGLSAAVVEALDAQWAEKWSPLQPSSEKLIEKAMGHIEIQG